MKRWDEESTNLDPLRRQMRKTMKTVRDFIFGGSKITADGDCSHEMKKNAYSLEGKL